MLLADFKIFFFAICVLIVLYISSFFLFSYRKELEFMSGVKNATEYSVDYEVDRLFNDFIRLTNFKIKNQEVSIKLIDFPEIYIWDKSSQINDLSGISLGFGDDKSVEIYLNYSDWKGLSSNGKKNIVISRITA